MQFICNWISSRYAVQSQLADVSMETFPPRHAAVLVVEQDFLFRVIDKDYILFYDSEERKAVA